MTPGDGMLALFPSGSASSRMSSLRLVSLCVFMHRGLAGDGGTDVTICYALFLFFCFFVPLPPFHFLCVFVFCLLLCLIFFFHSSICIRIATPPTPATATPATAVAAVISCRAAPPQDMNRS